MRQAVDPAVRRLRILLGWIVCFLLLWLAVEWITYSHRLSMLPDGLKAPFVLYARSKTFGLGMPGDTETGLVEYRMTAGEEARIERLGLAALPHELWTEWKQTPVRPLEPGYDGAFLTDGTGLAHPAGHRPSIDDFLSYRGFPVGIGDDRTRRIDDVLNSPGSFVGHDDHGWLIIVSPRTRRIFVAIN